MATHQIVEKKIYRNSKIAAERLSAETISQKQKGASVENDPSCKTNVNSERRETLSVLAFLNCLDDYEAAYSSVLC